MMSVFLSTLIVCSTYSHEDVLWRAVVEDYVAKVHSVSDEEYDKAVETALRMLDIERELGIPEHMLGMSIAAASVESGFNPNARGDHKFSKYGRPKAIGILQLWPWVERYGVNRSDLESSTRFWLSHIVRTGNKTRRLCRPRSERRAWRQAWVTAVRAPKPGGRCFEKPKHWRPFLRIRKIYDSYKNGDYGC